MQNLTSNQKDYLFHGGHVGTMITGETLDGDPIALTSDDIIEGSLSIERNWAHGSSVEIGCADTSELTFSLDNFEGQWSDIRWEGARLTVVLDIDGEPLQAGVFTVDEPPRKLTTMQIRALDDMARFNRPYEPGIAYPASLKQILLDCCQQCGVTLYTLEFDNGDYVVAQRPDGDDITFHHVVAWVAELAGCNAWIDELARLQLSWYGENQPETAVCEYSRDSPAIHPDTGAEVPADTPIFMSFAGDKRGLLMEEGTTNAFNNPSFEDGTTGWVTWGFDDNALLTSVTDDVYSGSKAVKVERVSGGLPATGATISQNIGTRIVLTQNQSVTVSFYVKGKGNTIGKTVWAHIYASDGTNTVSQGESYTLTGEWQRISYTLTWPYATSTTTIRGYCRVGDINIGDYFYVDAAQFEQKPYPTSFTVGTRANPATLLTLPEALPAEFGIGISAKMLHAHGIKSRTFWQAGDYHRLHYDTADSKLKMQFGEVTAEQEADWSADDIIGVYGGKKDGKLFVQAKVAGELGEKTAVEVGGRNLLKDSKGPWTNANYGLRSFPFGDAIPAAGEIYTITMKYTVGADRTHLAVYSSGGHRDLAYFYETDKNELGIASKTFTMRYADGRTPAEGFDYLTVFQFPSDGTSESTIEWIKLERGNEATPWTPAPEDGDTNDLYIGSLSDEGETPNAVIADFTLHDSGDIDPEGYLAGVPDDADGGGES